MSDETFSEIGLATLESWDAIVDGKAALARDLERVMHRWFELLKHSPNPPERPRPGAYTLERTWSMPLLDLVLRFRWSPDAPTEPVVELELSPSAKYNPLHGALLAAIDGLKEEASRIALDWERLVRDGDAGMVALWDEHVARADAMAAAIAAQPRYRVGRVLWDAANLLRRAENRGRLPEGMTLDVSPGGACPGLVYATPAYPIFLRLAWTVGAQTAYPELVFDARWGERSQLMLVLHRWADVGIADGPPFGGNRLCEELTHVVADLLAADPADDSAAIGASLARLMTALPEALHRLHTRRPT